MAEISPVLAHDIGPCLDRRQRLDIRPPVEVARIHDSIASRIAEDWDRIAGPAGAIENAVPCRDQPSVGPAFQQIADIADETVLDWHRLDPVAGPVENLQPAEIVLLQDGEYAEIGMRRRAEPFCPDIGLADRRIVDKLTRPSGRS